MTRAEDVSVAASFGVDAVGVIVDVPVETPRKLSVEEAASVLEAVPLFISKVAVIMPSSAGEALRFVDFLHPDVVQLHGAESPQLVSELKQEAPWVEVVKAFHISSDSSLDHVLSEVGRFEDMVDGVLLDTKSDRVGGTGLTHDWSISKQVAEAVSAPLVLSGGLSPDNVAEAVKTVNPYAVDVSSGVESAPGVKDHMKLKRFVEEVRCST